MSRKVDLNAPRNSRNDYSKSRNNHSFSHGITTNDTNNVSDDAENTTTNNNSLKQMAAEKGLQAVGVPKSVAKGVASEALNMDASDSFNGLVKFPVKLRVILWALIIGLPVIGIILFIVFFVVLFNDESGGVGSAQYIAIAEKCNKVTVTDTGANSYDGEIDFEDYIAGVVAGVGNGANDLEFYKTIAVMARTYFLANASSDCQVSGDSSFMEYMDVNVASDSELIKKAVSDTRSLVITNNDGELVDLSYSMACVVNSDETDYYIRYGVDSNNYQKIPVSFDNTDQIYKGKLKSLYNTVDKTNDNYENRSCPSGNDSNGISLIGALYLIKNNNYDYQKVFKYYYDEVNEAKAQGTFDGNVVNGFINPVENFTKCTSSYGCRKHPISGDYRYHGGIDIPVVEGTSVYATKAGKVSAVRTNVTGYLAGSYGNYVDIDHGDGTMTRYAHLKYGGVLVSVGTEVNQGQTIALSGNTGGSTGPHLHYEVHVNGSSVDPYNYLDTSVIGDAGSCNYGRSVAASYCKR